MPPGPLPPWKRPRRDNQQEDQPTSHRHHGTRSLEKQQAREADILNRRLAYRYREVFPCEPTPLVKSEPPPDKPRFAALAKCKTWNNLAARAATASARSSAAAAAGHPESVVSATPGSASVASAAPEEAESSATVDPAGRRLEKRQDRTPSCSPSASSRSSSSLRAGLAEIVKVEKQEVKRTKEEIDDQWGAIDRASRSL